MARQSSGPFLFDYCKSISTKDLIEKGLLKPMIRRSVIMKWTSNSGIETAAINALIDTHEHFIEMEYTCNGEPNLHRIRLTTIPSNLNKGLIWMFICPRTGIRCRKLYLSNGLFVHRSVLNGFYQWQIYSHKDRALCKIFDKVTLARQAHEIIHSKHFKRYYKGKPTNRYVKAMKSIMVGGSYPSGTIENLMAGIL